MKKFWYVSRDPATVGYHDPKQAFFTMEDAKAQAEVLCKKHGHDFYVMESVQMVKQSKPPIEWVSVPQITRVLNAGKRAEKKRDMLGRFTSYAYSDPYDESTY